MPSTPSPIRARKSAPERRREIADAAQALALSGGLSAVTLRAVAAEVGVAPGLVAHYEPNMDALVADAFAAVASTELSEVRTVLARDPSPLRQLQALIAMLLDGTRDDITRVWVQAWGLGDGNAPLAERVRSEMDAWQLVLEQVVAAGAAAGEFAASDAGAVARQLLGMVDGLNAHALVGWGSAEQRVDLMSHAVEGMLALPRGALARP